ncbi:MAG: hypothetical protein ACRDZO_06640, partial [Egibacteraceae bacterium]
IPRGSSTHPRNPMSDRTNYRTMSGVLESLNYSMITEGRALLGATAPEDRFDPVTQTIPTVSALLRRSTDRLDDETEERFAYLGVFAPKPATFSLEAMQSVWLVNDARPTARRLADRGLLEPIIASSRFQLHAVLVLHAKSLLDHE